MILHDLKVIFFHIGKAGGSTIERELANYSIDKELMHHHVKSPLFGKAKNESDFDIRKKYMMGFLDNQHNTNGVWSTYLQHADIEIYERIHGNNFYDYYKFTFVRNPLDRILSAYYYNGIDKRMSFESFVKSGTLFNSCEVNLKRKNSFFTNHFAPQHLFTHKNNKQYVDFIGKLENFTNDLNFVLSHLGLKTKETYPKLAKTKKSNIYKHYLDAYDNEMIEIIKTIYEIDFKLFDYSVDNIKIIN